MDKQTPGSLNKLHPSLAHAGAPATEDNLDVYRNHTTPINITNNDSNPENNVI